MKIGISSSGHNKAVPMGFETARVRDRAAASSYNKAVPMGFETSIRLRKEAI